MTGATSHTLANCLIELNRFDEASKLLENIDTKAVAQLTGVPDWSANLDLARADIAFRKGDYSAARKYIQPAIPVYSRPDAEPFQKHKLESLLAGIDKHLPAR